MSGVPCISRRQGAARGGLAGRARAGLAVVQRDVVLLAIRSTTCRCCRKVTHPVAVDPDETLKETALEKGWMIISLRVIAGRAARRARPSSSWSCSPGWPPPACVWAAGRAAFRLPVADVATALTGHTTGADQRHRPHRPLAACAGGLRLRRTARAGRRVAAGVVAQSAGGSLCARYLRWRRARPAGRDSLGLGYAPSQLAAWLERSRPCSRFSG